MQERKKQVATNTKRHVEEKESAKERLARIKGDKNWKAKEAARTINEDIQRRNEAV